MPASDFEKCIRENRLKKEAPDWRVVEKEIASSHHDLSSAKRSLGSRDFHWAVSQAYYSCFHSAKALVLAKGFREKSHYCLAIALEELHPEMPAGFAGLLLSLRRMRESADYTLEEISKEDASHAIEEAAGFLEYAKKTLKSAAAKRA